MTFCDKYKFNSIELKSIQKVVTIFSYHIDYTILSILFCLIPFCPYCIYLFL